MPTLASRQFGRGKNGGPNRAEKLGIDSELAKLSNSAVRQDAFDLEEVLGC
jgi:hypothetical protein